MDNAMTGKVFLHDIKTGVIIGQFLRITPIPHVGYKEKMFGVVSFFKDSSFFETMTYLRRLVERPFELTCTSSAISYTGSSTNYDSPSFRGEHNYLSSCIKRRPYMMSSGGKILDYIKITTVGFAINRQDFPPNAEGIYYTAIPNLEVVEMLANTPEKVT